VLQAPGAQRAQQRQRSPPAEEEAPLWRELSEQLALAAPAAQLTPEQSALALRQIALGGAPAL
jgi:hypothetical protein